MIGKHTKQEFWIIIMGALLLTCCFFGSSYALNNQVSKTAEFNYFGTSNLELSYVDRGMGNGDVLSLVNAQPISDLKAREQDGYRFSITNVSGGAYKYRIRLVEDDAMVNEDGCIDRQLYTDYIRFQFDNLEPKSLKEIESTGYVLYESTEMILPGNSEIHELRIWLSEDTPATVKDHYHGKVVLEEMEDTYLSYQQGQEIIIGEDSFLVMENSSSTNAYLKLLLNSSYSYINAECQTEQNCPLETAKELSSIMEKYRERMVADLGKNFDISILQIRPLDMNEYRTFLPTIPSLGTEPFLLYSLTNGRYEITNMKAGVNLTTVNSRVQPVILLHKALLEKEENESNG